MTKPRKKTGDLAKGGPSPCEGKSQGGDGAIGLESSCGWEAPGRGDLIEETIWLKIWGNYKGKEQSRKQ